MEGIGQEDFLGLSQYFGIHLRFKK